MTSSFWAWLVSLVLLSVPVLVSAQAQVAEGQIDKTIYVNTASSKASDDNPGTKALPFKTIARATTLALANKAQGISTKIIIAPGTYRENLTLHPAGKDTDAVLVVEGKKGKVVISGSDVWDGWAPQGTPNVYTHAWPYKWGMVPLPRGWEMVAVKPITLRREIVFANGTLLKQVLTPQELVTGSFYVDEEKELITIALPAGMKIEKTTIEVGVRSGVMNMNGLRNVVLRGITFTHDNTPLQGSAANIMYCNNVLVEDCRSLWNNFGGFGSHYTDYMTIRRCVFNYNGGSGMGSLRLHYLLFEDVDTSYNNWRGDWGDFRGWAVGGFKNHETQHAVFRRHKAIGNQTRALWFDTDSRDILIEDAEWRYNNGDGLFLEADPGPITLRNSLIADNTGAGVFTTTTEDVLIEGNTIVNNGSSQIFLNPREVVQMVIDGKVQDLRVQRWTLKDNIIADFTTANPLFDGNGWTHFLSTLRSSGNLWYSAKNRRPFYVDRTALSFTDWQEITGQDLNSRLTNPLLANPAKGNYTVTARSPINTKAFWPMRTDVRLNLPLLDKKRKELLSSNWMSVFPLAGSVKDDAAWTMLDLGPVANRPFTGGVDAWISGGEFFLYFAPGVKKIQGVPFTVLDQAKNNGMACVALRSKWIQQTYGKPTPTEVVVPCGKAARALYFLHGCGWTADHENIAEYQVVYQDGSKAVIPIMALGMGTKDIDVMVRWEKESVIQDWWTTNPQFENTTAKNVIITDPAVPGYLHYLYNFQWENPNPQKVIKEIRLLVADPKKDPSIFILAITALTGK